MMFEEPDMDMEVFWICFALWIIASLIPIR